MNIKIESLKSFKEKFKGEVSDLLCKRDLDIIAETIIEGKSADELSQKHEISYVRVKQIIRNCKFILKPEKERFIFIDKLNSLLKDYDLIHISKLKTINSQASHLRLNPALLRKRVNLFNYLANPKEQINLIGDKFISIYPETVLLKAIRTEIEAEGGQVNLFDLIDKIRISNINNIKAREFFSVFDRLTFINGIIFYGNFKSKTLKLILKNFFPEGIDLNNEVQFNSLVNYYKEFNNSERLSHSKDSYLATLYKYPDQIIKLNPFKFIHVDNDPISPGLLENICGDIEKDFREKEEVDIARYYNKYQDSLEF
ncbi:MAG: hypothetical protein ABR596_01460, partial [Halarsenatibacteraceae bacterium]